MTAIFAQRYQSVIVSLMGDGKACSPLSEDQTGVVMGTGWEYFNNVCQALRVAIGVAASIAGVVALFVIYGVVSAHLQAPQGDAAPTTIYQQAGGAQAASATVAPRNAASSAAPSRASNASASYGASGASPSASSSANAGAGQRSTARRPNMQPNPQFSGGDK